MQGFSLLELLIVIAIIGILLAITIPTTNQFGNAVNEDVLRSQLLRAINLARSEAIAKNTIVTLMKNNNWSDGYKIVTNNEVIRVFATPNPQGILYWRSFPLHKDILQFSASGWTNFQNGTFWYCAPHSTDPAWAIMINQSGRARVALPNAQGQIIDSKNNKLVCFTH